MLGRIHLLQIDKEKLAIIHHVAYDLRPGEQRRIDSPMYPPFPQRRNKSSNGPGCNNGSPPQNVTPPSERSMKTISFSISFIKASAEYSVPDISIAKGRTHLGTDSAQGTTRPIRHDPLRRECQCLLRTSLDACPATDAFLFRIEFLLPAGNSFRIMAPYARQGVHPFIKIVIRIPGPSLMAYRFISKQTSFSIAKRFLFRPHDHVQPADRHSMSLK